jgi:dipeptidyl-peptidase-4
MRGLYHQMPARKGFIVFSLDGPASQVDNSANVRLLYHNFGQGSLLGQRIAVEYLRSLPYVDASRIGIWGWSFGGYETTYALTHTSLFKAGVAGAPVTDWHLYDSIYTERYMGRPQDDPNAYDTNSSALAAANLQGHLLIVHGTSDDNVHMANSITFLQNAIESDKTQVDFMAYPRQRHGFSQLADWRAVYQRMMDWWVEHL